MVCFKISDKREEIFKNRFNTIHILMYISKPVEKNIMVAIKVIYTHRVKMALLDINKYM